MVKSESYEDKVLMEAHDKVRTDDRETPLRIKQEPPVLGQPFGLEKKGEEE